MEDNRLDRVRRILAGAPAGGGSVIVMGDGHGQIVGDNNHITVIKTERLVRPIRCTPKPGAEHITEAWAAWWRKSCGWRRSASAIRRPTSGCGPPLTGMSGCAPIA